MENGPPPPPPVEPQEDTAGTLPHALFEGPGIGRGCVLLRVWIAAFEKCPAPFARYAMLFAAGKAPLRSGRRRDLLPLPAVTRHDLSWPEQVHEGVQLTLAHALNHTIAGLNWLSAGGRSVAVPRKASAIQQRAIGMLLDRLLLAIGTLGESGADPCGLDAFLHATGGTGAGRYPTLDASRVDLPACAGLVDPMPCCDPAAAEIINDGTKLFPNGLGSIPTVDFM